MNSSNDNDTDTSIQGLIDQVLPTAAIVAEAAASGASIRELCGITEETMEGIYAFAHRFYTNGQLDEAEKFFRFLCLYDFHNGEYALGMGAVFQLQKKYEQAIELYALAFAMLKNDYRPMFHTGQCQLALGKPQIAAMCFDFVIESGNDEALVHRATHYKEALAASTHTE